MNDQDRIELIRKNVSQFVKACGHQHDNRNIEVLDIAPQDHEGAAPYFKEAKLETLDIDPNSSCTYILDYVMIIRARLSPIRSILLYVLKFWNMFCNHLMR